MAPTLLAVAEDAVPPAPRYAQRHRRRRLRRRSRRSNPSASRLRRRSTGRRCRTRNRRGSGCCWRRTTKAAVHVAASVAAAVAADRDADAHGRRSLRSRRSHHCRRRLPETAQRRRVGWRRATSVNLVKIRWDQTGAPPSALTVALMAFCAPPSANASDTAPATPAATEKPPLLAAAADRLRGDADRVACKVSTNPELSLAVRGSAVRPYRRRRR